MSILIPQISSRYKTGGSSPLGPVPIIRISHSTNLRVIPPIDRTSRAIISPTSGFANWTEVFDFYPTIKDFLLLPGNYEAMGDLTLNAMSGTALRPRTIRYYNPDDDYLHPWLRVGGNEALAGAVRFTNGSNYWHVHGLTQRGASTGMHDVLNGSHHIVWDWMLIHDSLQNYGIQLRGGGNNVVQRVLFMNTGTDDTDNLVAISPDLIDDAPMLGLEIIDCESCNYVDALLMGRHAVNFFQEIAATIEGNCFYVTSARDIGGGMRNTENALDFKGGADSQQTIVRNNRFWGLRSNGISSVGDAIEIHLMARNMLIERNIIGDSQYGIHEVNWPAPEDPETPRDIICNDNIWHDMRDHSGEAGAGSIFRITNNYDINRNWFGNSDFVVYSYSTLRAGGPVFNDNIRVDTVAFDPTSPGPDPWVEGDNSVQTETRYVQYERKRWSGIEIADTGLKAGQSLAGWNLIIPPVAAFETEVVGFTVHTEDESDGGGGADIVSWETDWGDGSTSSGQSPSHVYAANGIYTIGLLVTNSGGLQHFTHREVTIRVSPFRVQPEFVAMGVPAEGVGAISPEWPAGHVAGQRGWLVIEAGGTQTPALTVDAGFVLEATQTNNLVAGSVLQVYSCLATSNAMPSPTVNDSGDHQYAVIFTTKFQALAGYLHALAGDHEDASVVDVVIPAVGTTEENCLYIGISTTPFDSEAGQFSAWSNPSIENLTVRLNDGTSAGAGGGLGIVTGQKTVDGYCGKTLATLANAGRHARIAMAIMGFLA